jgi:hypothetical protein
MPISASNVHRIAALNPGDHGRRWLSWVEGEPGPWVVEDRVEPYWRASDWRAFRGRRARLEVVNSPFVARVRDVESDSVTLESWVPGPCLRDVAVGSQIETRVAGRIACHVAWALTEVHAAGARCQGLSPWDVVLGPLGVARLTQLAKSPLPGPDPPQITGRVGAPGRTAHLSPEALRGVALTAATDVFALGSTLYWLLEGATPFAAGTPIAEMMRTLEEEPTPLSRTDVDPAISALIGRMLDKAPAARPTSRQVVAALSEACGGCCPPVLGFTVSETLERLRDLLGDGELEGVAAVLAARPEFVQQAVVADYLVPQLLDDEAFDPARFAALSHFCARPEVASRLHQWAARDLVEPAVELPRRTRVDLGMFVVEACDQSWDELTPIDDIARHCDACGRQVIRAEDGAAALAHVGECVHAQPSELGFWDRLRRRLSRS